MPFHEIMIPEESKMPFAVKLSRLSWEPGYPLSQDRDYFILKEVANILVQKKVIRRATSVNWSKEELKVTGVQQVRKWLKQWRKENDKLAYLYKKSYKYGYLISKKEFLSIFEELTGGDVFIESNYEDCLLTLKNPGFFEYKVAAIQADIDKLHEKRVDATDEDLKEIFKKISELKEVQTYYRSNWYQTVYSDRWNLEEPRIVQVPASLGRSSNVEVEQLQAENEKLVLELEQLKEVLKQKNRV